MKILHFFPNEKFTVDYIVRINTLFPQREHIFFVYNNNNNICSENDLPFDNVIFGEIEDEKHSVSELFNSSDRIVLHSLFFNFKSKCFLLKLMKKYSKPVFWNIWGADLYNDYRTYHGSKNIKHILKEEVRKRLIAGLYGAIASEDYPELIKMYKTNAKQYVAAYSYKFIDNIPYTKTDNIINIMVGHSATETCRHLEAFEMLKPYEGKIRVYCPLSYPKDQDEYIEKVTNRGRELFGEQFYPMTDFMEYSDYVSFLNKIDIGVFNNDRQQGNGNIINLMYLGKKLYISSENNLLKTYEKLGAQLNTVDQINQSDFLEAYSEEIKKKNHQIIVDRYSDEAFYDQWNNVFRN